MVHGVTLARLSHEQQIIVLYDKTVQRRNSGCSSLLIIERKLGSTPKLYCQRSKLVITPACKSLRQA